MGAAKTIYDNECRRYYGLNESPYEFESRLWEIVHPGSMIRWEKLPGELRLERLKRQAELEVEE